MLEIHQQQYTKQSDEFAAKADFWRGVYKERKASHAGDINEAVQAIQSFDYSATLAKGAAEAMQQLIDVCDLKE